ncbi:STAS domain-containing protein [Streptomyces sp. NPDC086091]|uniref:STAS domain-containing protein n=1 Tax=Streptomyces sp. NPDC086091 TaxID=3365751 RepID=UPI003817064F
MSLTDLELSTTERSGGRIVVAAAGALDLHTAGGLYARAERLLAGHALVVVDLSGIEFCDSTGYNALLRLRRRALEADTRFVLAAAPPVVGRLLALTGADMVFEVHETLASALATHPAGGEG